MGRFDSLVLDEDQRHYRQCVIENAELLEESIMKGVPDSREKSLALTKLEECVMWAVKGIISRG